VYSTAPGNSGELTRVGSRDYMNTLCCADSLWDSVSFEDAAFLCEVKIKYESSRTTGTFIPPNHSLCGAVPFQHLTVSQTAQTFSVSYGARRFNSAFAAARHWDRPEPHATSPHTPYPTPRTPRRSHPRVAHLSGTSPRAIQPKQCMHIMWNAGYMPRPSHPPPPV
jgi:hypothetical protein